MIFLARHGEKADAGRDPGLTPQGQQRARHIAAMLGQSGVEAIFSTPVARALQTAQPLAQQLGLAVQPYDAAMPKLLVEKVKALSGAVLVIGHSNTLPELVQLFGGAPGTEIDEEEYDRLYLLVDGPGGKVTTVRLTSP